MTTIKTLTATYKEDQVNHIHKSDHSTETVETADMSVTSRVSYDEDYKEILDDFTETIKLDADKQQEQQQTEESSSNSSSDISFGEYTEYVDKINEAISPKAEKQDHLRNLSQSTPDMRSHYAGIWYPECKNCRCCQGFKFGCNCAPLNDGACMCITGGLSGVTGFAPDDVSVMTINSFDAWTSQSSFHSSFQCRPAKAERRRSKRRGKIAKEPVKINSPCRFFFSEMGCRKGEACQFNHTKEESSGGD